MRKILSIIIAIYVFIGGLLMLTPKKVIANDNTVYMAGLVGDHNSCNCPVRVGNCVCAIDLSELF